MNKQEDSEDSDALGREDSSPGNDLVENLPPGPDTKVITKREDKDRSWLLRVFLSLFSFTLVADIVCGAWLPAQAWAQVKPEIANIRTFLFQVALVIIGFYYGRRHRN